MDVKVLSRKLLAPSPLPDHPLTLKLSSIDQLAPPIYVDCIFYYAPTHNHGFNNTPKERLQCMEKSLSDTLAVFYPLAGRYHENDLSIECNDQGVEFLEAKVNGQLDQLRPGAKLLSKFVAPYALHSPTSPLLSIQVNVFDCGGFAIGLKISHLVADAYTISLFANQWAVTCKLGKTDDFFHPSFDLASIFPSRDVFSGCKPLRELHPSCPRDSIVTTRFVFDKKSISRLKDVDKSQASRVQVVTALVWRVLMRASKAKRDGKPRASLLTHAFNMRGKITSVHVADHSCGNLWRLVLASFTPTGDDTETELTKVMGLVRDAIGNAASECGRSSINGDDVFLMGREGWRESGEAKVYEDEVDVYDFTSWCGMRHYEVDFGWGRPCWMSSVNIPVDGLVVLLDTKDGHGVEAWVSLLAQDKMVLFERDDDIVEYTSDGGVLSCAVEEIQSHVLSSIM